MPDLGSCFKTAGKERGPFLGGTEMGCGKPILPF